MTQDEKPGWVKHLIMFIIIFALGGMFVFQGRACRPSVQLRPADARIVPIRIDRWEIKAEIADTPELRRKGLSNRPALEPGYGMLFVFEEPSPVRFWMKDTSIPLSIAFIKEDGTIAQIEQMKPQDLTFILSRDAVKYALEVRQGWFEERGIKPGARVVIPEIKTTAPGSRPLEPAEKPTEAPPEE
jgi:uncharacterized membrane protein (UPF0127 family)